MKNRSHCEARKSRGNPTKRRAAFSVTSHGIYDKGITTSGNNKVEIATGAALAMTICSALLVMTIVFSAN